MKNFVLYLIFISGLLAACQNHKNSSGGDDEKKNVSKRDYSINKSNSYSDLFLDSTAMEKFIVSKKVPDSISRRMRSFYNTRNYEFAWFNSDGLNEQTYAFWNLHDYVTTYDNDTSLRDKKLQKKMDALTAEESLSPTASTDYINTELTLTEHFIKYILNNYDKGYVKRKEMERFIPFKKQDALYLADSLLNKKHKDDKYFEDVNAPYKALKDQLAKYYNIAKAGGWPQINTSKKTLKKGLADPAIPAIKKRLAITGEMIGNDTSQIFDDTLEMAVKTFQTRMGYTANGSINEQLINDMNVPAIERVKQILVNMGRMRWMPTEPNGRLIIVNIPEFALHVYENKRKVWDMDVVVGKEGHNTTMFTGDLNQIVFSPYWNVPPSIVQKEILPKMESDPDYLASQHMEENGTDENGIPKIRQLPGPDNSLGRVKFLFPNSFNIYFHDTNAKSLFEKDKRAFSHGCIRLADPERMAQYLLRDQPEWTTQKIEEAMNSGHEQYVKLKHPVPVIITYYTAWVDDNGQLNFRDDIYDHDKTVGGNMFTGGY
jgi:murein L,D-transpeptidase YcbB/YkuD